MSDSSGQARSTFGLYEQSETLLTQIALDGGTGLRPAASGHFSRPMDIHKIFLIADGSDIDAGTAIRVTVVDRIAGISAVRSSEVATVGTAIVAASGNEGIGIYREITPLRLDPGEEAQIELMVAGGAGQTARAGFLCRAFAFEAPGPLTQAGLAPPVNRIANTREVPLQ